MGTWVLYDDEHERAVLYDSVTERPFGPGFCGPSAQGEAEGFLRFVVAKCGRHAIAALESSTLENLHIDWHERTRCATCGREINFDRISDLIDRSDEDFLTTVGEGNIHPFTCATMAQNTAEDLEGTEEEVKDGRIFSSSDGVRWINARPRPRCASLGLELVRS